MSATWGVHNDTLTTELVEGGFVSVGWDEVTDLRDLGASRDEVKASLARAYEDSKPMTVASWAGTMLRFRDEMRVGDVVVAPYRPDGTVNIGVIGSDYYVEPAAETHRHRRRVTWKRVGIPRATFSEQARFEIGSLLAVFAIRKNADEFRAVLEAAGTDEDAVKAAESVARATLSEPDSAGEIRASRVAQHTRDFVLERLLRDVSHVQFEEFTADLLRAMGYQARATQHSRDGGVDVVAHRDPLGVEPPLIKVQCKHHTGKIGSPEVSQLIGTLREREVGMFVTLGTYSPDAVAAERSRPGVRLLTGDDVVDLFLDYYDELDARWRTLVPLTPVLVVADAADS